MDRLPFDPGRAVGPPEPEARSERPLRVGEVAALIKGTLERHTPASLRVVGEVSNLRCQGHWYFSLRDEEAVLGCVAWASTARTFGFEPKEGDAVVATGHLSHYERSGRTQLYVSALAPLGAGALDLRFRALCEELRGLGYFDEARKKPLPLFPRRIAVITSRQAAALQDVLDTAARRCRAVGLVVVDVRVQGPGAAEQVAEAIRRVDREHERLGVDAILVTRGGGSTEDLWAFNERVVADAAVACTIPLVAAIGHESDTTVIELAADLRAATPTQAVMRLIPSAEQLDDQLRHAGERLTLLMMRRLERARQRVEAAARHPFLKDPSSVVRQAQLRVRAGGRALVQAARQRPTTERLRLDGRSTRLSSAAGRRVERSRARLEAVAASIRAVDPRAVLGRGYSITTRADGRVVRSRDDVRDGDPMRTQVADGTIDSVVGVPGPKTQPSDQMDLFAGSG
jgi:exodeoxyribonuclease VII large subunit